MDDLARPRCGSTIATSRVGPLSVGALGRRRDVKCWGLIDCRWQSAGGPARRQWPPLRTILLEGSSSCGRPIRSRDGDERARSGERGDVVVQLRRGEGRCRSCEAGPVVEIRRVRSVEHVLHREGDNSRAPAMPGACVLRVLRPREATHLRRVSPCRPVTAGPPGLPTAPREASAGTGSRSTAGSRRPTDRAVPRRKASVRRATTAPRARALTTSAAGVLGQRPGERLAPPLAQPGGASRHARLVAVRYRASESARPRPSDAAISSRAASVR